MLWQGTVLFKTICPLLVKIIHFFITLLVLKPSKPSELFRIQSFGFIRQRKFLKQNNESDDRKCQTRLQ